MNYSEDALKIRKEIRFREGEARALGNAGLIYEDKGDLDQALEYLNEALKIFEEIGMQPNVEQTLRNIKRVEEEQKEWKK